MEDQEAGVLTDVELEALVVRDYVTNVELVAAAAMVVIRCSDRVFPKQKGEKKKRTNELDKKNYSVSSAT